MVLPPTLMGRIVQFLFQVNMTIYSFGQSDCAASNTDRTHCPVPIPGEHDDFSFKCAYVESFGVAPFFNSVDGFLRTLPTDPCITYFGECYKIIGKRLEVTRYFFSGELK